jgi:hypothetical protein
LLDLQGHEAPEPGAPFAGRDEAAVHLFEQELLPWAPVLEGEEAGERFGAAEAEAFGQAQGVFVEEAAQVLLGAGAVLGASLVGAQEFAPLPGVGVGLPDLDGQSAEVDAGDLDGIDAVIGEVALANLAGAVAFEDEDLAAEGLEPFADGEGVGAGFDDEDIGRGGVAGGPGAERFQGLFGDAVGDAGLERIAALEDGGGEGVGMDVEADGAAFRAELWRGIGGLLW